MCVRLYYVKLFLFFLCMCMYSAENDNRIIGGRPAKEGEFPFQVSIRRSYNDFYFCGGSIISQKHVLTAAHCMHYIWGGVLPPLVVSIVAGQLHLNITNDSIYRNASKIIIHPNYDKNVMANDLAVIELSEDLPLNNKLIAAISLRHTIGYNLSCLVVGWGVQEFNSTEVSNDLLATEVKTLNLSSCFYKYAQANIELVEGMLCAANVNKEADACQGDSGGPLICEGKLTGIVSTGRGCGNAEYPGIYSDVYYFLPWIRNVTGLNLDVTITRNSSLSTSTNSFSYKQITTTDYQIFDNTQPESTDTDSTVLSTILSDYEFDGLEINSSSHFKLEVILTVVNVIIIGFSIINLCSYAYFFAIFLQLP